MRSAFSFGVLLGLCIVAAAPAQAKKQPRKTRTTSNDKTAQTQKKPATAPPTQTDQLKRLQQLVHQPVANE